jgi:hypothetical protein
VLSFLFACEGERKDTGDLTFADMHEALVQPGKVFYAEFKSSDEGDGQTETRCFSAEVTGREHVNGREAHVVTVLPSPETCPHDPKPLKKATLWIATENDAALKMEYEGDRSGDNSSFELTLFESFEWLPDSTFRFAPPAGSEVIEFTTHAELKSAFIPIVPRGSTVTLTGPLQPAIEAETPGN